MTLDDINQKRMKRNKELVELVRLGYTGCFIKPESTFFPPRPIIKKDPEAVKKLYGVDTKTIDEKPMLILMT